MTLPAALTDDVRGLEGPKYKVGPKCSNPNCNRGADHAHHIERRSKIGVHNWIQIKGRDYPNLCGLCFRCHDDITGPPGGHKAAIHLVEEQWWWCLVSKPDTFPPYQENGYVWSPPAWFVESDAPERIQLKTGEWVLPIAPLDPHPPTLQQITEQAPAHPVSGSELCPTCGQTRRRRAGDPRPSVRRRRKSWTVKVPDDDEDGAAVLDTLVEDLAIVLGYEGDNGRYYVLVPTLTFAQLNRAQFSREIEGLAK